MTHRNFPNDPTPDIEHLVASGGLAEVATTVPLGGQGWHGAQEAMAGEIEEMRAAGVPLQLSATEEWEHDAGGGDSDLPGDDSD